MLREAIKEGSDLGKEAKAIMDRGSWFQTRSYLSMIKEKLENAESKALYLMGSTQLGAGRALDEILRKLKLELDLVIEIVVKDDVLISRIENRARESKDARSDDNAEVLKKIECVPSEHRND